MSLNLELPKGHIKELDGLRGTAIGLVVLFHCFSTQPLDRFTALGWTGVDLFFVLSGFLITGILLDTKNRAHYYRNFIFKRALRIFPLYYFTLAAFFTLNHYFRFAPDNLQSHQFWFWTYTQNIYFSFNGWFQGESNLLNHFWSLAQEEQFYLFWPIVVYYFSPVKTIRFCLLGIIVSLVLRNIHPANPFSYVFFFSRFDSMLIGGLAAILIRQNREWLNRFVRPLALASLATLLIALAVTRNMDSKAIFFIRAGYTVFDVFFGCLILLTLDSSPSGVIFKKIFRSKLLVFLGKYSYGIYVYHWIFLGTVFPKYFFWPNLTTHHTFNVLVAATCFTVLVIILSVISFHVFELRFLNLKKRFE